MPTTPRKAAAMPAAEAPDLLAVLVAQNVLRAEQVERLRRAQKVNGLGVEQAVLQLGLASDAQIAQALAAQAGLPYVKINPLDLDLDVVTKALAGPFARKHGMVAIAKTNDRITIAVHDPFAPFPLEDIKRVTGLDVDRVVATRSDVERSTRASTTCKSSLQHAEKQLTESRIATVDLGNQEFLSKAATELDPAAAPGGQGARPHPRLRLRAARLRHPLRAQAQPDAGPPAHRRRAARRAPDPARSSTRRSSRASSCSRAPTSPRSAGPRTAASSASRAARRSSCASAPCRPPSARRPCCASSTPTSCSRASTSWALAARRARSSTTSSRGRPASSWSRGPPAAARRRRSTRCSSTSRSPRSTSSRSRTRSRWCSRTSTRCRCARRSTSPSPRRLRTVLRQDPDIVMVGEIRDSETADNAVQAALTGHLVLSTLHTNDAPVVDHAAARPGRAPLPDHLHPDRRPRPAAGARELPPLQRGVRADRGRGGGAEDPVREAAALPLQARQGLPALPRDRLPRPHGHLRDAAA